MVEFKARGNIRPEKFNLYASPVGVIDSTQDNLLEIELTDEWQAYTLEFTTDEDIEPGKQYIRI